MWNPLDLLKPISNIFTSWNDGRVKLKEKKIDVKHAIMENKARLARDSSSNNHDWEMANLEDKDRWLRRISFGMFSAPFVWALFDAEADPGAQHYLLLGPPLPYLSCLWFYEVN